MHVRLKLSARQKRHLREAAAEEKRRDHELIANLESRIASLRAIFEAQEKILEDKLERAYRAKKGTIYDATAWFHITWRGPSGRKHKFAKPVRRRNGWWTAKDGTKLCPAINNSVVKAVLVKKKARK